MIADFFTKPLQGKLFKKIRDIIMGLAPFPMEERVEKRDNEKTSVNTASNLKCTKDLLKISKKK